MSEKPSSLPFRSLAKFQEAENREKLSFVIAAAYRHADFSRPTAVRFLSLPLGILLQIITLMLKRIVRSLIFEEQ